MTTGLRLVARDADDLKVIAACLQDALIPQVDMRYLPAERRFCMMANRFRWERQSGENKAAKTAPQGQDASFQDDDDYPTSRSNAGICIENVVAVRSKGIDRSKPGEFLSLMTLQLEEGGNLDLIFANGGAIQLQIEGLQIYLQDFGAAWPTQWRPEHDVSRKAGA